jgi:hypothetical protein
MGFWLLDQHFAFDSDQHGELILRTHKRSMFFLLCKPGQRHLVTWNKHALSGREITKNKSHVSMQFLFVGCDQGMTQGILRIGYWPVVSQSNVK